MLEAIDLRLDMSLSMSARIGDMNLPILEDQMKSVPMSIYLRGKETAFNFFLDSASVDRVALLENLSPVYYGSFVMITQKVELPAIRLIYQNISSVPSMILNRFYTLNGELLVEYRFHQSDLKNVSNLAKTLVSIGKDVRVTRIGKSRGVKNGLDEIDANFPLSVVRFRYKEEPTGDETIEWRGVSDPFGAVSYGSKATDNVMRIDFSKSAINPLFRILLKDQIQPVTYFEEYNGSAVKSTVIIPSLLTKSFLVRFFNFGQDMEGLQLEWIAPYSKVKEDL
jgi:hypothetical protein